MIGELNNMKIENTEVYGFKASFKGMRNAKNSWHLSDSYSVNCNKDEFILYQGEERNYNLERYIIGEKDLKLAQTLIKAGAEHCKFMRQIQVWCEITSPRYFWSEFDTYKIGTSANSTSTMHKLFDKKTEITLDMFEYHVEIEKQSILTAIENLNKLRDIYFEVQDQQSKDNVLTSAKRILPESYLNMRTVNMNYATIRNILLQRRHHRLKLEWQECFGKWVTTLPYAKELIFCGLEDDYNRLKSL
jgi:hypothetical protein